jgi:hypothetical protein
VFLAIKRISAQAIHSDLAAGFGLEVIAFVTVSRLRLATIGY